MKTPPFLLLQSMVSGSWLAGGKGGNPPPPKPAENFFGQALPPRQKNLATALGFQAVREDVDWTRSGEIASNIRPVILSAPDVRVSASSHQESLIVSRTLLNFLHIHATTGNKTFSSLAINFAIIFQVRSWQEVENFL